MTEGSDWTDIDLARLRLEGLDHLTRFRSGEATDHDAAAFITWRGTSRAHEEAFRAAVRLTRLVGLVDADGVGAEAAVQSVADDVDLTDVTPIRPVAVTRRVSRRAFMGGAIAASAAGGVLLLGRSLDVVPSPTQMAADYRTEPGERRIIKLARGVTAELNTRTSVDLHEGLGLPAIALISGEAMVASGSRGKAAVVAGAGTSIVTDGRLNARRDGAAVCITCLDGAVEVAWRDQNHRLGPADQLRYDDDRMGSVKAGADPAVLTAWRSGTLIFHDMPMRDVVAEINRYRIGRVFLANARLRARKLSGTYHVDGLDDFFRQAQLVLGVKVTRMPGEVVILS